MTCFIGVDIGLNGGIGILQDGERPLVVRMPTIEIKGTSKRTKHEVDFARLQSWLESLQVKHNGDLFVMFERPQLRPAMMKETVTCEKCGHDKEEWVPNQGIVSQTNFIGQWREFRGLLRGMKIAQEDVHPATWKADVFRGQPGRDKDAARAKAAQLFPAIADKFKTKNSDGMAEALLLADYGRRRRRSSAENPF